MSKRKQARNYIAINYAGTTNQPTAKVTSKQTELNPKAWIASVKGAGVIATAERIAEPVAIRQGLKTYTFFIN